jgi:hypothetical protein
MPCMPDRKILLRDPVVLYKRVSKIVILEKLDIFGDFRGSPLKLEALVQLLLPW